MSPTFWLKDRNTTSNQHLWDDHPVVVIIQSGTLDIYIRKQLDQVVSFLEPCTICIFRQLFFKYQSK